LKAGKVVASILQLYLNYVFRLQAIATPVVSGMEKVQVIPPPKDVSPQILAWKGAAVLGKMESISELWVTPSDWVIFSIKHSEGLHLNLLAGDSGYTRPERAMLLPLKVHSCLDCFVCIGLFKIRNSTNVEAK